MLANIIDNWGASAQQMLGVLRIGIFPLVVAGLAVWALVVKKSVGALAGVLFIAAIASVPVYNPGALNSITSAMGF